MRLTQGAFSYLPDLTDSEIAAQVRFALDQGWAVSIEYTEDPHPRNPYWDMWGLPMFDAADCDAVLFEIRECREAFPGRYVRVNAYDSSYGRQTTALQFLVARPEDEPGFRYERREGPGRSVGYGLAPYALDRPPGLRS